MIQSKTIYQLPITSCQFGKIGKVLNLGHLYFDIVSNFVLRISDFASLGISTTVESALQIAPFMQNKPNLSDDQMNANMVLTMDYEKRTLGKRGKNKPNTNPIQTQTNPITEKQKMTVNKVLTNGYENKSHFWVKAKQTQFKPKQSQFPKRSK